MNEASSQVGVIAGEKPGTLNLDGVIDAGLFQFGFQVEQLRGFSSRENPIQGYELLGRPIPVIVKSLVHFRKPDVVPRLGLASYFQKTHHLKSRRG
jgi:hypothetical protein